MPHAQTPRAERIDRWLPRCAMGCLGFFFIGTALFVLGLWQVNKHADQYFVERAARATWLTYTHNGLGFSFDYPDDYTFTDTLSSPTDVTDTGRTASLPNPEHCSVGIVSPASEHCGFRAEFYNDGLKVLWAASDTVTDGTSVTVNGYPAQMQTGVEHGDLYEKAYTSYTFRLHNGNLSFRFYNEPLNPLELHILNSIRLQE